MWGRLLSVCDPPRCSRLAPVVAHFWPQQQQCLGCGQGYGGEEAEDLVSCATPGCPGKRPGTRLPVGLSRGHVCLATITRGLPWRPLRELSLQPLPSLPRLAGGSLSLRRP